MLALAAAVLAPTAEPIELLRTFRAGETLKYQVRSHLQVEQKDIQMGFFLPSDLDINYDATIRVTELKEEGFADVIYSRPTMTIIDGETADRPPISTTERSNIRAQMTLSPINELTGVKELSNASPMPFRRAERLAMLTEAVGARMAQPALPFVDELYRLCLFVGSIDSSLELSPKLPFEEVAIGDTWKRTVSYTPQRLKGTNRTVVQRLDATYTYDGIKTKAGKRVHQVTGRITMSSDAAALLNSMSGMTAAESRITGLPLKLDATIVFDLDEKNLTTLRAEANAKSSWQLLTTVTSGPAIEERLTGRTRLTLAQ
jgi:hypothetical protein